MARLTEEMVVARSKQSDLYAIKKLNCWGAELGDVSVLRQMPNVEVLALSLNKIHTLVDFAWCQRLKELYIRKNDIRDLREIRHLRRLASLKNLWLDENPCTEHPEYRMTVLRNLPQLEVLDNVAVHPDEVTEASRRGAHIPDSDEEDNDEFQQLANEEPQQQWREPSPEREPVREYDADDYQERREPDRRDADYDRREYAQNNDYQREPNADYRDDRRDYHADCRENSDRRDVREDRREEWREPKEVVERRESERAEQREIRETPRDRDRDRDREPPEWREYERRECSGQPPRANIMTRSYMGAPSAVRSPEGPLRHSMSVQSIQECAATATGTGTGTVAVAESDWHETQPRSERVSSESRPSSCACAVMGERRGFTRRPVARNSNLLSAVLCLVKELDYPSLEVVELAVRCRMDELANSHI